MNSSLRLLTRLLTAVGLMVTCLRADAQGFGLGVTASTNLVVGTNSVTYNISLTNQVGGFLENVVVSNTLSMTVALLGATNSQGTNFVSSSSLVFILGPMTNGASAQMALTVQPSSPGFLTNDIVVFTTTTTNTATTSVLVQVLSSQTDLGVSIVRPVQVVITNDLTSYGLVVTNIGPGTATNVLLTNTLPAGVILKGASRAYSLAGSNMIFNLGTLGGGGQAGLQVSIQPTNVGALILSAAVGAPNLLDYNTNNNSAITNVAVISYLPGTLVAVTNSAQNTNLQNGLTEQSILLSNTGTNDVPAVRVVVTGLTNQLVNAVGTNGSSPYVVYSARLAAGKSVNLLLQYYPRGSFPFTNGQLHAFAVPLPDWTPPAVATTKTNLNISRIVKLPDGNMLIEFPIHRGRAYTVVYSDNVLFSNAMIAPPSIMAAANVTAMD